MAVEIIQSQPKLREKLRNNIEFMRKGLRELGFSVTQDPTAIIPLVIGDLKRTMEFSRRLFDEHVFVQGIRPPTVPEGKSRLRITVMASHTEDDLRFALEKITIIAKELCLI